MSSNNSKKEKLRDELRTQLEGYRKRNAEVFGRNEKSHSSGYRDLGLLALSSFLALLMVVGTAAVFMWGPPRHFPVGTVVRVEEGQTLREVAQHLSARNVIRFPALFIASVRYAHGGDESVVAGDYFFSQRRNLFSVARAVATGDYGLVPHAVRVPEGASVTQMADLLEQELDSFDSEEFVRLGLPLEGYLFPDTYYFLPNVSERHVIETMNNNFREKIAEISEEIELSGHSLHEVVTMASIIEKEAENSDRARRTISGVLWKRISVDMPLQVDAVFPYIIGRNTFELTLEDLKVDSPYNTYRYKGLPPGPIANPGLASLKAAIDPIESDFLFYLADLNGRTHFAETFEEHKWNKRRYLD